METKIQEYSMVLTQVNSILNYLPKEFYSKIPNKMISEIQKNVSQDYVYNYDKDKGLDDPEIFEETKDFISAIYVSYLCDDKRKEELVEICKQNDIKIQKELEEKYSIDNMFKKPEVKKDENIEEATSVSQESKELIVIEEKWYTKIFSKIKDFFASFKK